MNDLKAIVFDLDDTLYPEAEYVTSGFRAVAAWAAVRWNLAANDVFGELQTLFRRGVRGNTFAVWLGDRRLADSVDARVEQQMVQVYRDHVPTIAPFRTAVCLLESLRLTYRLGLVSDGWLEVQRRKLAALGIATHFDAVVFSDEFGRDCWKPSPVPFQQILRQLDTLACQAVYVADNVAKDFLGPRQLGMRTIQFARTAGLYVDQQPSSPQHAADLIIADLSELPTALAELSRKFN